MPNAGVYESSGEKGRRGVGKCPFSSEQCCSSEYSSVVQSTQKSAKKRWNRTERQHRAPPAKNKAAVQAKDAACIAGNDGLLRLLRFRLPSHKYGIQSVTWKRGLLCLRIVGLLYVPNIRHIMPRAASADVSLLQSSKLGSQTQCNYSAPLEKEFVPSRSDPSRSHQGRAISPRHPAR